MYVFFFNCLCLLSFLEPKGFVSSYRGSSVIISLYPKEMRVLHKAHLWVSFDATRSYRRSYLFILMC